MTETAPHEDALTTLIPAEGAEPAPADRAEPTTGFGRRGVIVLVVLALLLASTIVTGVLWLSGRAEEADRAAALDAARAAAVSLSSISADTADADVQRVLDSGTGDFGDLFRQNLGAYVQMVKDSQVGSTGEVTAAALSEVDSDSAKALVAVRSEVRNSQTPDPQPRLYRMQMDLVKEGDRWLVATLTFAS